MKPSTLKWLSKAIALPLFIATLNIATTASAEQIDRLDRSRSISSRESRSKIVDDTPVVTDLNLTIPDSTTESSDNNRDRSSLVETNRSRDRQNNSSITVREQPRKPKSTSRPRNIIATNIDATISTNREQPSKNRSMIRRRNLVATNIDVASETISKYNHKLKSNSRHKLAAGSPPPLSGNYLKLVRDRNKGTNDIGNPIYTLEAYVEGQRYQTFNAVSGTATTQNVDRHRGNNFAPLPDGLYHVNDQIMSGTVPEVGRTFVAISPQFSTGRSDLGIHLDRSFNKRNGYDGTAGCIGLTTIADRDAINDFVTKYHPRNLFVNIISPEN